MNSPQPESCEPLAPTGSPSDAITVSAPPEALETSSIGLQPLNAPGKYPIAFQTTPLSLTVPPTVVGQSGSVAPLVPAVVA